MAFYGCLNGLVVTALLAVLAIPTTYLVSKESARKEEISSPAPSEAVGAHSLDYASAGFPPLDAIITSTLLLMGLLNYACEWIHRKMVERRLVKLNRYLSRSVELLREWEARQDRKESALKLAQKPISDRNLLLQLPATQAAEALRRRLRRKLIAGSHYKSQLTGYSLMVVDISI